jgi:hypothetical protein
VEAFWWWANSANGALIPPRCYGAARVDRERRRAEAINQFLRLKETLEMNDGAQSNGTGELTNKEYLKELRKLQAKLCEPQEWVKYWESGMAGFDARADVNGDGIVDIRDLAFVSQHLPIGTSPYPRS